MLARVKPLIKPPSNASREKFYLGHGLGVACPKLYTARRNSVGLGYVLLSPAVSAPVANSGPRRIKNYCSGIDV